jgi:uncharacterized SAM-binding protein YcdF (DUF218 family)
LAVFAIVAVLGTGAWVGGNWLLTSAADFWIISDPLGPADAVAIFGGGLGDRPFAAAQYYRQGLVTKVLVSDNRRDPAERYGRVMSEVAASEAILLSLGTPESAIATFGNALGNTHQEVLALRDWAERHNLRSIIVPTEIFSTRRVRWMLHRAFPSGFVIRVIAVETSEYRRDDWWRHVQGVTAFENEFIKYVYYVLKYQVLDSLH